ncbi:hypothetical protein [Pseudomonas sp. DWP3-1-2]|uniref:hypothetical protein n=1 Tax=Pseudomonas sp. DWP3-1-2 TaxID=2804645 RepID=UPI003CF3E71C
MKKTNLYKEATKSEINPLSSLGIIYTDETWVLTPHGSDLADKQVKIEWRKGREKSPLSSHYIDLLKKFATGMLLGVRGDFSPRTIKPKVLFLRRLFSALQVNGYERIGLVTTSVIVKIIGDEARKGRGVTKDTFEWWVTTINQFYRLKIFINDCFIGQPISRKDITRISISLREPGYWEAPTEPACIFLLKKSMDFMKNHSEQILRFYEKYISVVNNGIANGRCSSKQLSKYIESNLSHEDFANVFKGIDGCEKWSADAISIGKLTKYLSTACFITITFTCGQRVSEVRRASSTSVVSRIHDSGFEHFYYNAPRSKRRYSAEDRRSDGTGHSNFPWILSPAAVEAFNILIKLSKPAREKGGMDNLWLTSCGNSLWPFFPKKAFSVLSPSQINIRINNFASFIDLEANTGWKGRLHSHMGRKHLARFVAKRDRSALGDLAQQYSHLSADSIDMSYAKPDSEFQRMLTEELSSEMAKVGHALLEASESGVYSTPGNDRVGKFVGELRKARDIKLLFSSGTLMIPCQWGVCLYMQQTSACEGTKTKPDIVKRSPLVCSKCTNFVATSRNLLWWLEFKTDCNKVLSQSNLPVQTKLLLEKRLAAAETVIEKIKDYDHE